MFVGTTLIGNTLTCYSCTDCGDPFKSNNVATVTVPANQGYYCRVSSSLVYYNLNGFIIK